MKVLLIGIILIDVQKYFDTVSHIILLKDLEATVFFRTNVCDGFRHIFVKEYSL